MQEMIKACGRYCRRWSKTVDILQEILRAWDKQWNMVRDCGHTAGDGQKLGTYCKRWSEATDILQEMVRA